MALNPTWKTLNRPPLVVFTLCLTAFSLTTLCLAYYIRNAENFTNPNVDWEWKRFFKHLSTLDVCLSHSTPSSLETTIPSASSIFSTSNELNPSTIEPQVNNMPEEEMNNVTIMFGLSFSLVEHLSIRWPPNLTSFVGNIDVTGWTSCTDESNAQIELALYFPRNHSHDHQVCARFTGPKSLLPPTPSSNFRESTCNMIIQKANNETSIARLEAQPRLFENGENLHLEERCMNEGSTLVRIDYSPNPKLTIYLTMHDRSIMNLHLMHTTYFLMVMAATIICYALIRRRAKKTVSEKIHLDT